MVSRQREWEQEYEERIANTPDPDLPPGHKVMPDHERRATLEKLKHSMFWTLYIRLDMKYNLNARLRNNLMNLYRGVDIILPCSVVTGKSFCWSDNPKHFIWMCIIFRKSAMGYDLF